MARVKLHGDPTTPIRGAVVVAHLRPRSFAWIIRTGAEINRPALAALCSDPSLRESIARSAFGRAETLVRDRGTDARYLTRTSVRTLVRIAGRALRRRYARQGPYPKGQARIATEALMLRAILTVAADRLRTATGG